MLLAELHSIGFCFDCLPTGITYGFASFITPGGGPVVDWSVQVMPSDVGQIFSAPTGLLPDFDLVLSHPGHIGVSTSFIVNNTGDVRTAYTPALTFGSSSSVPSVLRTAPVLGPNFFAYRITGITMEIDKLKIEEFSSGRFRAEGEHTVRIYGEPIPALPGDYNQNGKVDAADYVIWRDRVTDNEFMPNGTGEGLFEGRAVQQDYDFWRAHYGTFVAASAKSVAVSVPEPATSMLFIAALFCRFGLWIVSGRHSSVHVGVLLCRI
jgi:hypothetical protein